MLASSLSIWKNIISWLLSLYQLLVQSGKQLILHCIHIVKTITGNFTVLILLATIFELTMKHIGLFSRFHKGLLLLLDRLGKVSDLWMQALHHRIVHWKLLKSKLDVLKILLLSLMQSLSIRLSSLVFIWFNLLIHTSDIYFQY